MFRRNFLKLGILALLGKKSKAGQRTVPFIPTLEFLQEHDGRVVFIYITYSSSPYWDGVKTTNKTNVVWEGRVLRKDDLRGAYSGDNGVNIAFDNGEWVTYNRRIREENGQVVFERVLWPNWLRKF